mmetsp:Transcript_78594/g.168426  ORF Transcript_78594/g.168426 Transcript_78594/m.168426 type:complete len:246 (+) Transcript_78594:322-1059(+)
MVPQQVTRLPVPGLDAENPRRVILPLLHAPDVRLPRQGLSVPDSDLGPMLHDLGQQLDLRADKGSPQAIHFRIGRSLEVQEVISRVETMVDERLEAVVVFSVPSVDPPTIPCCDRLVGVQRSDTEVSKCTDKLAVVSLRSHSFANVLYQPPAPLFAEFCDCYDVLASHAVSVADDDSFGARRHLLQELLHAWVQGAGGAVAVDWLRAHHLDHVGHRYHSERRHQDLVLWAQIAGQQGHMQPRGTR